MCRVHDTSVKFVSTIIRCLLRLTAFNKDKTATQSVLVTCSCTDKPAEGIAANRSKVFVRCDRDGWRSPSASSLEYNTIHRVPLRGRLKMQPFVAGDLSLAGQRARCSGDAPPKRPPNGWDRINWAVVGDSHLNQTDVLEFMHTCSGCTIDKRVRLCSATSCICYSQALAILSTSACGPCCHRLSPPHTHMSRVYLRCITHALHLCASLWELRGFLCGRRDPSPLQYF